MTTETAGTSPKARGPDEFALLATLALARFGLPEVSCGTNSYWWRGYGALSPEIVILVGFSRASAEHFANQVELAGHITNPYGVRNEETKAHPDIFVCRGFKQPWPEFWKKIQRFG